MKQERKEFITALEFEVFLTMYCGMRIAALVSESYGYTVAYEILQASSPLFVATMGVFYVIRGLWRDMHGEV